MRLLSLCLIFCIVGCDKVPTESRSDSEFPKGFQGDWIFDEGAATSAIDKMPIEEEAKLKLQSSFIGMIRNESRNVDSTGRITGGSYPDELVVRLHVVEERQDGVVVRASNSMNPDAIQFTLNTISNGVWRSRLLDDSLNPVEGMPDDFWKRPEQKSAGQGVGGQPATPPRVGD